MKHHLLAALTLLALFAWGSPAQARQTIWRVISPDHGQTYAYGSEVRQSWAMLGPDHHLALYAKYSNEPYAEGAGRRYDDFTFNFPQIKLGSDGQTFFYHASNGSNLLVARKKPGFLGIPEIKLLPTAYLVPQKIHGYVTMTLVIGVAPFQENPNFEINFAH